ncbi:hypothetical protein JXJ21_01970 [candidate division KSB1 bacterium]|nr:hypothetical protein [candidate division KSB1 bacterium]
MPKDLNHNAKWILVAVLIIALSCSIDKPKAPSWELDLKVPLTSKSYQMSEIADDSEHLYAEGKEFGVIIEGEFDTTFVADNLTIEPVEEKASFELGVFEIASADTQVDSSLTLDRFWAPATQYVGSSVAVPSFAFHLGRDDGATYEFDDFIMIAIDSGAADLRITNNFLFPLGLPLILELKDSYTDQTLSTLEFDEPIPGGAVVLRQFEIRDKVFSNKLYIQFTGQSAGSDTSKIFMEMSERILILELSVSNLFASYAKAQLPEIHFDKTESLELTHEMILTKAKFRTGRFKLNVNNHLPLDAHFVLTFLDLFDANGRNYSMNVDLGKQSRVEYDEIDLSGWTLQTNSNPMDLIQTMRVRYQGYTDSTKAQLVEVSKNDSISVDTYLKDVTLEYVRGAINRLEVEMPGVEQDIDLKYRLSGIRLRNASLQLIVHNRIAFPIELDMTMTGSLASGDQRVYTLRETIEPASWIIGQATSVEYITPLTVNQTHSQYNSFMNFINLMPDKIDIQGKVFIGQLGVEGMVHRDDYIFGNYKVKAPFELAFEDTTINFDTVLVNINPTDYEGQKPDSIDEELDASITEDLSDATLWLALENHLPVAVEVLVRMDTSMSNVFGGGPCIVDKAFQLTAASTNDNGIVTSTLQDTISLNLTRDEFALFKNTSSPPKIKTVVVGTQLHLPGTDGKTIVVQADDYVAIRESYIRFSYLIEND